MKYHFFNILKLSSSNFKEIIILLVLTPIFLTGCKEESKTKTYSVSGSIQTESESKLENALVTIDGIEATELTTSQGSFIVNSNDDFESTALLSVAKDGYESHSQEVTLTANGHAYTVEDNITLTTTNPWGHLEVDVQPSNQSSSLLRYSEIDAQKSLTAKADVCDCTVAVSGKAYKKGGKNSTAYILLAVDASGSSAEQTIGDETVFEVEVNALTTLVNRLTENDQLKIGIIRFASQASIALDFTSDLGLVKNTLSAMTPETPDSSEAATNYKAALELAITKFDGQNPKKKDIKSMVFLSDGIPTFPSGSGATQESGDRLAAINTAELLKEENIIVNTFAVNINSKLTTLPAISAITGGFYYKHADEPTSSSIIKNSLVGLTGIEVFNETTDTQAPDFELLPDGNFNGEVCLTDDSDNLIKVTPLVCDDCDQPAYQKIKASCAKEECSPCAGQITMLELEYNGLLGSALISVEQSKNGKKREVIFEDIVLLGGHFQFFGSAKDKTMGPTIYVYINGILNAEFSTSCGQPKTVPGLINGDIKVVRGYSRNGGLICDG
ncbi:MAG: VWA domain-containing protein [Bermanella sp.]